jgi:hypothetical protein
MWFLALFTATSVIVGPFGPADWPPFPKHSCHATEPNRHVINLTNATHAQCAAACEGHGGCSCFDLSPQGSCHGSLDALFRSSTDRTAYANNTAPRPPPPPPHPPHPPPPPPPDSAPFWLHPLINSNAVLQRAPARAAIYGWAKTAGATISVQFRGKVYESTVAGNDTSLGSLMWRVELPPVPASVIPENITIAGLGTTATLANVLFGDVWMCGGQSNMAVPLDETFEWFHPNVANDTNYPIHVLQFKTPGGLNASTYIFVTTRLFLGWSPPTKTSPHSPRSATTLAKRCTSGWPRKATLYRLDWCKMSWEDR